MPAGVVAHDQHRHRGEAPTRRPGTIVQQHGAGRGRVPAASRSTYEDTLRSPSRRCSACRSTTLPDPVGPHRRAWSTPSPSQQPEPRIRRPASSSTPIPIRTSSFQFASPPQDGDPVLGHRQHDGDQRRPHLRHLHANSTMPTAVLRRAPCIPMRTWIEDESGNVASARRGHALSHRVGPRHAVPASTSPARRATCASAWSRPWSTPSGSPTRAPIATTDVVIEQRPADRPRVRRVRSAAEPTIDGNLLSFKHPVAAAGREQADRHQSRARPDGGAGLDADQPHQRASTRRATRFRPRSSAALRAGAPPSDGEAAAHAARCRRR